MRITSNLIKNSKIFGILWRSIRILAIVYIVFGFYLYFFQNSIIYHPDNQDFNSCAGFDDSEKIVINGTRAYYKQNTKKLIIFYHGNAGSACDRDFIKDFFEGLDYSYLFVEYSGYAGDSKKPSRELIYKDVENVNEFISKLEYENLVLAGESLGSAPASYHSTLIEADKILLISPFDNSMSLAHDKYFFYPRFVFREYYNNAENLQSTEAELLFIHGSREKVVPLRNAKSLFEKVENQEKEFIEIKNAGHNDLHKRSETWSAIRDFL